MLKAFRTKMLKSGARQKGTFCLQYFLEGAQRINLFSFDPANAQEEEIEEIKEQVNKLLNKSYANSHTFMGSVTTKTVIYLHI